MKNTGIIRKVDELGRIVLPKEMRDKLNILEKDSLEIYVQGEKIILEKYSTTCCLCGTSKNLKEFKEKIICTNCIKEISKIT